MRVRPLIKHRFVLTSIWTLLLIILVYLYNFTITPLDRPFFLSEKKETIIAVSVDWMCNCANFVEINKFEKDPVSELKRNDYFFIEPNSPDLALNQDFFSNNKYVKLTGQFYIDKGIPEIFKLGQIEDKPSHARIFRYVKIEYLKAE